MKNAILKVSIYFSKHFTLECFKVDSIILPLSNWNYCSRGRRELLLNQCIRTWASVLAWVLGLRYLDSYPFHQKGQRKNGKSPIHTFESFQLRQT